MKDLFQTALSLIGTVLILLAVYAQAQGPGPASIGSTEMEQGVCAFKNKNFGLAQTEFEKAFRADPKNKLAGLFAARSIFFQYDPKLHTAENTAKGRAAIDVYMKVLAAEPDNDEASDVITYLYEQLDADKLEQIADSVTIPKQVRTALLIKLVSTLNTCANDITYENKTEVRLNGKAGYKYHLPKDPNDLVKAQNCTRDGMQLVEKALAIDASNESAWSYKASLSIQLARLAEMQQNAVDKARFEKQMAEAKTVFLKLSDEKKAKQQKADEELERRASQPENADKGMLQMADFITTGKLIRKVKVDETSIDSPTVAIMDRLDPPGPATEERPKPAAPAKALWKMFSPPDEGFSAMMPSYVDSGRKTYHAENEGRAYWINYIDRPAAAPVGPDEMMAGLAWALADITCNFSIATKANCDIHLSKKITLGAYPGVEYVITEDNCGKTYPGVIRAYATPNRIYTIMVTGGDENDPNAGKFLSTFKINK